MLLLLLDMWTHMRGVRLMEVFPVDRAWGRKRVGRRGGKTEH